MQDIKVLILDFDGIIVESVGIKTRAFRELFKGYPEHVDRIVDFHLNNDGLSRYKKFDYIYANILKAPLDEELSSRLGERFSELALEEIKRCPFVPGAVELLEAYRDRVPIYIASGTPEPELREIVEVRGLAAYFTGVCGTPASKSEIIADILTKENLLPEGCLFIGDTLTDYREAVKVGVRFIGRWDGKLPPENPFLKLDITVVDDMTGALRLLAGEAAVTVKETGA